MTCAEVVIILYNSWNMQESPYNFTFHPILRNFVSAPNGFLLLSRWYDACEIISVVHMTLYPFANCTYIVLLDYYLLSCLFLYTYSID